MKRGACLAFAALLAVSACGGSGNERLSRAAYQAKLHSAFVAAQAADTAAHQDRSDRLKVLEAVAATYAGLAATLRDTRAPVNVQALNDRLVAGASAEAKALGNLASKLERVPTEQRNRALAEFDATQTPGQHLFDSAVAALETRGYRFRPSAGR